MSTKQESAHATATVYPATIHELGDMAEARGMGIVALMEQLMPFPEPPAGYIASEEVDGLWTAPEIRAAGVVVIPTWNYRTQSHEVELWTGKGTDDEAMVRLCPADAVQVSASLTAAARAAK
jgi:hypothetical protein